MPTAPSNWPTVQCEKLFGYTRDELVGKSVEMLVPGDTRERHPALREAFHSSPSPREMGSGRELRGLRKDGSAFPVEIGLEPTSARRGQGGQVAVSIRDITGRQGRRSRIAKADGRTPAHQFPLRHALDLTRAGYWHVPLDGSGWYNSSSRTGRPHLRRSSHGRPSLLARSLGRSRQGRG